MPKQKSLLFVSLMLVAALLVIAGGNAASVSAQGGTPAATAGAAMQPIPGSGKVTGPMDGEAKSLNGAGATFPAVLYTKWFSDYAKLTGVQINYQSIGSGRGIKSTSDQTVDFGAGD